MNRINLSLLLLLISGTIMYAQKPDMVLVKGGEFRMGNDYSINKNEMPEHKVTLNDFMIGKYEITFEEFDKFCMSAGTMQPADAGFGRGKRPAMNVSWEEAVMYCNWLSGVDGLEQCYTIQRDSVKTIVTCNFDANGYRLPTEAEWEYAAKGGDKSKKYAYSGSFDPGEVAWFYRNSNGIPHEVGSKKPNELGIFDMSGNVPEWCWDLYDVKYYQNSDANNPKGPSKGVDRVFRGGAWKSKTDGLRLTYREAMGPNRPYGSIGFRVVKKP